MGILSKKRSVDQMAPYHAQTGAPVVIRRPVSSRPRQRKRVNAMSRGFEGADTGRLLGSWTSSPQHPDAIIRNDLTRLQARSRDAFLNNPVMRRFVDLVRNNVIGPSGIKLQAQAKSSKVDGLDSLANRAIEESFMDWGRAENCDFTQRISWKEMQRQGITCMAVDGEILARMYRGKQYGPYGFMVQHLDPFILDPMYSTDVKNGSYLRMGIEFDNRGRPIAYHIRDNAVSPLSYTGYEGRTYTRVPADQIIHVYNPLQIGQSRGYPMASPILQTLKMLDGYFEAAIVAARAGASKMGFITSADGIGYSGEGVDEEGAVISEFEAGIIDQLADGQTFTAFDPRYPHEQFDSFIKACLRMACGGVGSSYSSLSGDLESVNYSSGKIGLSEERSHWMTMQDLFISGYCSPVYRNWLPMSLLAEMITVNGRPLSEPAEKYQRVSWQGRRWPSPDPGKDASANQKNLEMNAMTVSSIIREGGRDPEEVFQERSDELARMKELNLTDAVVVGQQAGG